MVNGYTCDVYGKKTSSTGSQANEFDFAGQQTDPTGLQYLRARYYDPETGTFLSRDPLAGSSGWTGSPTGYANADPANQADPFGLSPCWVFAKVCTNPLDLLGPLVSSVGAATDLVGRGVAAGLEAAAVIKTVGEYGFKKGLGIAEDLGDSGRSAVLKCIRNAAGCVSALSSIGDGVALYAMAGLIVAVGCGIGAGTIPVTGPGGVLLCAEAVLAATAAATAGTFVIRNAVNDLRKLGEDRSKCYPGRRTC